MHAQKRNWALHEPPPRRYPAEVGCARSGGAPPEPSAGSWAQCMRESESGLPMNRARDAALVAQVFNRLYRRFPIGRPHVLPSREHSLPQPRVHGPNACAKSENGLSINRPNCNARWRRFSLSPSEGERAGERGPFSRLGSWSQCMRKSETGLSMNRANCDARCRSFSLAPSEGERVGVRGPFSRPQVHGPNACAKAKAGFP